MTDAPDLTNRKVLVVEDDYFIASDTAAALRGAGAEVLGPCPNQEATLDLLQSRTPTHVVLDLNLGGGGPFNDVSLLAHNRNCAGQCPADLAIGLVHTTLELGSLSLSDRIDHR